MLGVLIRNSPGAIVGFVVYSFVLPTLSLVLGNFQQWWEDLRPWLDFNWAQGELYDGSLTGTEWAQLGTSGPDLAGRPPDRRPGDGDAVGGEVRTSDHQAARRGPPARTASGGPRMTSVTAGHLRPWSDAGGQRSWLPSSDALPRLVSPCSCAGGRAAGGGRAGVRGRHRRDLDERRRALRPLPAAPDLLRPAGRAGHACSGGWRSRSPTRDGQVSEGTVVNSATNPSTSGTVMVTFCGSEPAGTYTVRATGFYQLLPAAPAALRPARDHLPGPARGHPHRARREAARPRALPAHRARARAGRARLRPRERPAGPARAARLRALEAAPRPHADDRPRPRGGAGRRARRPADPRGGAARTTTSPGPTSGTVTL